MSRGRVYRDEGVVLRTIKLGESDRIVSLLTVDHGKVRAVVKGARKTGSKMGSRLEPLRHVAVQLYEGRSLDTVTQADTIDAFAAVRTDYDRLARAIALAEAIDQIAPEKEPVPHLLRMLLGGLRTLAEQPAPAVVGAFYWKLLAGEGWGPDVSMCVGCGEPDDLVAIDLHEGGSWCGRCRPAGAGMRVSAQVLALVRAVTGGGLRQVLDLQASPATAELEHLATRCLEHHVERRMRAVRLLDAR